MAHNKPKPVKRRTPPPIQYCTYMIEVIDWKVRYSFSTNRNRPRTLGPYSEYSAIDITGKLILPEKNSETVIEGNIYGRREYDPYISSPEEYDKVDSHSVGIINIRKDYSSFWGWVPFTAFPLIANMFATKDFNYLQLFGEPLKYRSASIYSLDLRKDYDPEDC